ncbi:MAG: hypothetical protein HZB29_12475 [Nitrospinae bacterium]|nr:hypothetical protein [Nitrospinota bacterium]
MMLTRLISFFIFACFMISCAGRQPQPITVYQPDDEHRSCRALDVELSQTEDEINKKYAEHVKKREGQVALAFVSGLLFWPGAFFLDLKESEKVEYDALRQRYNRLLIIAADKECGFDRKSVPAIDERMQTAKPSNSQLLEDAKSGKYLKKPESTPKGGETVGNSHP